MKRFYFIRHGEPDFPQEESICLGKTDFQLSRLGRLQGVLAAEAFYGMHIHLFSSPLARAIQTAQCFQAPFDVLPGLSEISMGQWDGLKFSEIRERYPQLYTARGKDPSLLVPGQEPPEEAARRFKAAITEQLQSNQKDIPVFITHAGVMGLFLQEFSRLPKPAYGSVIPLGWDGERFYLVEPPQQPRPPLTASLCQKLLQGCYVSPKIYKHCKAVAEKAAFLTDTLISHNIPLDRELVIAAAWLHDIARTEPNHPAAGGRLLRLLGYDTVGSIITLHHSPEEAKDLDEAAIVFLADKLILENFTVTLSERFAASEKKCTSQEQRAMHRQRLLAAQVLGQKVNSLCGRAVVEL